MNDVTPPETAGTPLRKLNPAPRLPLRVRIRVDGAPGDFSSVRGTVQYDVVNAAQCGKRDALSGAVPSITSNETFELTRLSDTEFTGVVYADRILDENYYGRGVCRWELTEARVALRAGGAEQDARFVAGIKGSQLAAGATAAKYYWGGYYPRAKQDGFADFGQKDLEQVPADKRAEFFRILISATGDGA